MRVVSVWIWESTNKLHARRAGYSSKLSFEIDWIKIKTEVYKLRIKTLFLIFYRIIWPFLKLEGVSSASFTPKRRSEVPPSLWSASVFSIFCHKKSKIYNKKATTRTNIRIKFWLGRMRISRRDQGSPFVKIVLGSFFYIIILLIIFFLFFFVGAVMLMLLLVLVLAAAC